MTASSLRRAERRRTARDQRRDEYIQRAIAIGAVDAARRAGVSRPIITSLRDTSWAADDHNWFAHNPTCAHRVRPAFPGEARESAWPTETPRVRAPYRSVRQIELGDRLRAAFFRSIAASDTSPSGIFLSRVVRRVVIG
jgi:hypothetical protein